MLTTLNRIICSLVLLFATASAIAVTNEDLENDLKKLGIPLGATVWTDERLKKSELRNGWDGSYLQSLRTFTKIKVLGANVLEKPKCQFSCHVVVLQVELEDGRSFDLDFGYADYWRGGENGTFALALNVKEPKKTYPSWGKRVLEAIAAGEVFVGMKDYQVVMSWGFPSHKRTTHTRTLKHEQWVYGDPLNGASYIYLKDGKVSAIQQ